MATRAVEMEVMRDCHVMLVNATKTCYMSLAGDLFRASLITEHIKSAMYLNLTGREKAEELIDCVRSNVGGAPEAIYIFIQVLHRNGLEEVAKILEEKLKQGITHCIHSPSKVTVRNSGRLTTPESLVILSAALPVDRQFQVRLCTSTYYLLEQNLICNSSSTSEESLK